MTITLDSKAEDIASTLELDDSELEAELALELKSLTSTLEMTRLDVVEKPLPEEAGRGEGNYRVVIIFSCSTSWR